LRLTLISVGKNGEPFVREACADYAARIRRYAALDLIVVPEERVKASGKKEFILHQEARRIREKIPSCAFRVILDERGKNVSSEGFSRMLEKWMTTGIRGLVFILGGAYGLDEGLKQEADLRFSLSPLTLTHGMARMILLEQIYRAFTLIRKEPYHKE
jgi:23S rRNA (pseudouridine1915-N3)-methyltransferase